MLEADVEKMKIPKELENAVDEAVDMIREQMQNPSVYNDKAQWALDKMSAYAALFKTESALATIRGSRNMVTFLNKHAEAMEFMINSLKYKIRVVTNS